MQKELLYQNKQIRYWVEGTGKPVMLVHGFAEDHTVWENQVNHLQDKCMLILPDLPGSGQSALTEDVSMEGMADVLRAIVQNEALETCLIIGHSMGGYVMLAYAEKYGDSLSALSLFHSTAYADTEEKKQTRAKAIEFIRKNGVEEFLKTTTPNLFAKEKEQPAEKTQMIQRLIDQYKTMKPEALIAYYQAMMNRPDRKTILKTFTKPILFLIGKHDTAVPYEQGLEQTHLARLPIVHTFYHSGHMGMMEEPEKSNLILEEFIQNNGR